MHRSETSNIKKKKNIGSIQINFYINFFNDKHKNVGSDDAKNILYKICSFAIILFELFSIKICVFI